MVKSAAKKNDAAGEAYLAKKLARPAADNLRSPTQKLIINVSPVDNNGKRIAEHVGKFHIEGTDLYSETITLRPLELQNKLIKMVESKKDGQSKWSYVNESVYFANYGDVIYDRKGGIACGKILGAARKELSKEEAKENDKKASSFLYIFGFATFPGHEPVLVDFRVGGQRIIAFNDAMSWKGIPKGNHMSQYDYTLTCVPVAGTSHPQIEIAFDEKNVLPIEDAVIAGNDAVSAYIAEHNARIVSAYKRYAVQAETTETDDSLEIGEDE